MASKTSITIGCGSCSRQMEAARTEVARTTLNSEDPHIAWARAARDAMATYGKGGVYVNFMGEGEEVNRRASYSPDIYRRLQSVKDQYDPSNVFRFNMNIPPS
jgi:FAD/FMN-containing dehydrogenase